MLKASSAELSQHDCNFFFICTNGSLESSIVGFPDHFQGDTSTTIPTVTQDLKFGYPQVATDAAKKRYVDSKVTSGSGLTQTEGDARYLKKTGGSLSGNLNLQNNRISGLASPTGAAGATNCGWVESYATGTFLPLAGGTLRGN